MPKMASGTLFFHTNNLDAPFEEGIEYLIGIFKVVPVTFNEAFEFSKELFDRG